MRTLLPGDNPQAYIPEDRRRALARGDDLPLLTHGSALFIDIAGYTPLAEALAHAYGERRGAEELTATVDRITAALIEVLHAWRASIVYFSGDAVTAWIDRDDGSPGDRLRSGAATGDGPGRQRQPRRAATAGLGLKVAVAVGPVHRFVVGDPAVQLIDVLAGQLMDSLAAAEQQAQVRRRRARRRRAGASLGDRVMLRETRHGDVGPVGVVERTGRRPPTTSVTPSEWPRLPDETAREWLLPAVWERMVAGRGEFLAELRPAVPVFVRFAGLDFDEDPEAPRRPRRLRDPRPAGARRAGRLGPPAHHRRQGRLSLRRVRCAGRPRGRRGAGLRGGSAAAGDRRRGARSPTCRSGSRPDGSAAAPTATPSAARSAASATP